MRLSDYKNEDALELLADLLEPVGNISSDKAFIATIKKSTRFEIAQYLLKNHKGDIITILARLNGQKREEYSANAMQMLTQLLEIINDKELVDFFQSQGLKALGASSGSVMENTEETGEA